MIRQFSGRAIGRVWMVGMIAVGVLATASPALAQALGSLRGNVVDEAGNPVEAEVVFKYLGDIELSVTVKTNSKGEFVKTGMRTGDWQMKATAGELTGVQNVKVIIQQMVKAPTLTIKAVAAGAVDASGMTDEEVEKRNKLMATMQAEFDAAVALIGTDPADAIAKLTVVAGEIENCAICYTRIGEAEMQRGGDEAAEAAFKKSIELDPKLADNYSKLAILYNQQKKFDEATAMSQKANEMAGAGGTGGDPAAIYNQGIIYWNQGGKAAEAKAEFEKAIKLDPTMADAYYWLGMANVNLGQLPDAAKAFEEYIKLAPDGQFAEMAKGILKQIK